MQRMIQRVTEAEEEIKTTTTTKTKKKELYLVKL